MELYEMLTGISRTPTGLLKKKIHLLNSCWYNKEKKSGFPGSPQLTANHLVTVQWSSTYNQWLSDYNPFSKLQ